MCGEHVHNRIRVVLLAAALDHRFQRVVMDASDMIVIPGVVVPLEDREDVPRFSRTLRTSAAIPHKMVAAAVKLLVDEHDRGHRCGREVARKPAEFLLRQVGVAPVEIPAVIIGPGGGEIGVEHNDMQPLRVEGII